MVEDGMPDGINTEATEPPSETRPPAPMDPLPIPQTQLPPTGSGADARPATNGAAFTLGLLSAIPAIYVGWWLGTMLRWLIAGDAFAPDISPFDSLLLWGAPALPFFGYLLAYVVGKSRGSIGLRSFGKGGMWGYAAAALLLLLVFGSCLILFSNSGF